MRQWRKLFGGLAIFAVLLHTGLVVRHGSAMLGTKLSQIEMLSSLASICHGGGGTALLPSADIPDLPAPKTNGGDCPLCLGHCSVVALLPGQFIVADIRHPISVKLEIISERIAGRVEQLRPPPTGPPRIV